jgi:alkylation response protein AidB-like acyl-CoA dehydrogenase
VDLYFDENKRALWDKMRAFVDKELTREFVREFDKKDEFPHALLKKLSDLEISGINIAPEYGGMGGDIVDLMIIFENLARRLPTLCWALGNILLYGNEIIGINGSKEQKEKFLPKLAKGEITFSFAITEPNAGSDAAAIKTKAVYEDGHYVLNGNKMFITGAGVTDYTITFVRTDKSRYGGITAFIVDTKSEGYSARSIKKLGYHGSNTCEVNYDNVKVLPQDILGGEDGLNNGWQQEMKLLNQERLLLSSMALGIGQGAVEDAVEFAKQRMGSVKADGDYQAIKHSLVEMATDLEAARALAYHTAWKEARGLECVKETSMTKCFCGETVKKIVLQGINILGEYGCSMDYDMQRYMREIPILSIGGGTSQVQKNIIAKLIGL